MGISVLRELWDKKWYSFCTSKGIYEMEDPIRRAIILIDELSDTREFKNVYIVTLTSEFSLELIKKDNFINVYSGLTELELSTRIICAALPHI